MLTYDKVLLIFRTLFRQTADICLQNYTNLNFLVQKFETVLFNVQHWKYRMCRGVQFFGGFKHMA